MKFFNPTLETFSWPCDGKHYVFTRQETTEVPDNLAPFIEEQCAARGIFALRYGIDFKATHRRALITYLKECLSIRLSYVAAHKYDIKMKSGVELADSPLWARWRRWYTEIMKKLELEAPIEEEISFLTEAEMTKLGINSEKLVAFEEAGIIEKDVFKKIESAEQIYSPKPILGESFDNLEFAEEVAAHKEDIEEVVPAVATKKQASRGKKSVQVSA